MLKLTSRALMTLTCALLACTGALLLQPVTADAKCSSAFFHAWPRPSKTASPDQIFILYAGAHHKDKLNTLEKLHVTLQVKLPNDEKVSFIPYNSLGVYDGNNERALVLRPSQTLPVGATVSLRFKGQESYEADRMTWRVAAPPASATSPDPAGLARAITVGTPTYSPYGCGPGRLIHLNLSAPSPTPLIWMVTLRSEEGGDERVYPVVTAADATSIDIGHGMCSGDFRLADDEFYFISLKLLMDDGSLTPITAAPIKARAPSAKR